MPTLPLVPGHSTLYDVAKTFGPDGKVLVVAELLNQSNELIQYMNFIEGNLPTGHKASVRVGLPVVTYRQFYKGVAVSKSGRATIEDVCAMLEGRNEIDKDLAELNGYAPAFRASEALAFVESMRETFAQGVMYGDTSVNKDGILGLTPRYNSLSAISGANVIDAGGTGVDNTSVWLVVWGANTVTGIYPKASKAGLQQEDLGIIDAFDANNNRYRAFAEWWQWKFGLHVADWRYAIRIANVDISDLTGQTGTQAINAATWINKLMIKALARVPSMGMGTPTFLASRTVKEMLSIGALDKSQNALSFTAAVNQYGDVRPGSVGGAGTGLSGGQLLFQGVPVLTVDQILPTENRVQ
jgi:hypothetical protein